MKRPNMPSPLKSAGSAVLSSPTHRPTAGEVGPADVTGQLLSALLAYKAGDFCVRLPSDWTGVPGKIADAFNEIVEFNERLSSETARVSRAVGKEGVNQMAGHRTAQVRNITEVTIAVANGDLSRKITLDVRGEILQLKEAMNTMVEQLRSFASEVTRVAREVGTEGKLGGQAIVPGVAGTWKDLTDNVNSMASNLTAQVRNIAEVTTAVARGDLSRKITVDVNGESI